MKRIYSDYIEDILNSIKDIEDFTSSISYGEFVKDRKTVNAVVRSLEVMGEASKNIPNSLRKKYPEIPWARIAGMRDKLIHEYFGVDLEIVWQVMQDDIPPLKPELENLFNELLWEENKDKKRTS